MAAQTADLEPTDHPGKSELLLERGDPVDTALRLAEHAHQRIHILVLDRAHPLDHALELVGLCEALGTDGFRDRMKVIFEARSDSRADRCLVLAWKCEKHRRQPVLGELLAR